jgi:hypothetical protein
VVEVSIKCWQYTAVLYVGTLTPMQYDRSCCEEKGEVSGFLLGSCVVSGTPPVVAEVFDGIPQSLTANKISTVRPHPVLCVVLKLLSSYPAFNSV